ARGEVAWLRPKGTKPQYVRKLRGKKRVRTAALTPECRGQLREINLPFHDLRREAGSRWMDASVPLATIQRWLGHHNISQTSTYLAATGGGDADAMKAYEQAAGRLTKVDESAGSNGSQPTSTDN